MPRRLPIRIPQSVEEIDAAWLTHAIRSAGLIEAANVVGFRAGSPGSGVGFQGQTIRISLDWDIEESDTPDAVLVKFPTDNVGNRGLAEAEGSYDREFDFYERLSGDFPIRVPRLIHAVRDPGPSPAARRRREGLVDGLPAPVVKFIGRHARKLVRPSKRRYALVMEYIPDARITTAADLPPAEDLSAILRTLAEMHAHFWGDSRLADDSVFEWSMVTQMPNVMHGLYRAWRDEVVEREPGVFTDELMRHADWVGDHIVDLAAHLNEPLSIRHGDCRTDNMLFTDDGLVMIDFGAAGSGRPAGDVAYLLSEAIPPGPGARATFLRLCREYHDRLVAAGVTDHPLDEFLNDCDIVLAVQAYRVVLIEAAFEADYEGESLSHLWGPRVRSLLADGLPRF
ncbi:MAG TPA: aminoglycoside phosphotransferase family protein [Acidimicrobiia bacterium]|nr:aminoglycoside phosphotransferase family protein [Acidimicrobiia bacterium]